MAKGLYTPQNCKVCSREFNSVMSLARHLTQAHPMTTKEYFDTYLKQDGEGVCSCGKPTRFLNLNTGYQNVCGHSCASVKFRSEQKADPVRYAAFTKNVATAQAKVWANRTEEEKQAIFEKITASDGWKARVPNQFVTPDDFKQTLERIGKKDCKLFGIDPGLSAWETSQAVINENIAAALEIAHG